MDKAKQYYSPYVAFGNNPVNKYDPDGNTDLDPKMAKLILEGFTTALNIGAKTTAKRRLYEYHNPYDWKSFDISYRFDKIKTDAVRDRIHGFVSFKVNNIQIRHAHLTLENTKEGVTIDFIRFKPKPIAGLGAKYKSGAYVIEIYGNGKVQEGGDNILVGYIQIPVEFKEDFFKLQELYLSLVDGVTLEAILNDPKLSNDEKSRLKQYYESKGELTTEPLEVTDIEVKNP